MINSIQNYVSWEVLNCLEIPSRVVPDGSVEGPQTANLDCTVLHPNCNLCNPIAIFFNRIYTATLRKSCSIFSQFTWFSLLSCRTYFIFSATFYFILCFRNLCKCIATYLFRYVFFSYIRISLLTHTFSWQFGLFLLCFLHPPIYFLMPISHKLLFLTFSKQL